MLAFVQQRCDLYNASMSNMLTALEDCGLSCNTCTMVQVSPMSLEGMYQSIVNVAAAVDVSEQGAILCKELCCPLSIVQESLMKRAPLTCPCVLSLEGLASLCILGGCLPDIKIVGGYEVALGDMGGAPV